jgi:hypothetical protein
MNCETIEHTKIIYNTERKPHMQREESNCEKKGEKLIKREENYI